MAGVSIQPEADRMQKKRQRRGLQSAFCSDPSHVQATELIKCVKRKGWQQCRSLSGVIIHACLRSASKHFDSPLTLVKNTSIQFHPGTLFQPLLQPDTRCAEGKKSLLFFHHYYETDRLRLPPHF